MKGSNEEVLVQIGNLENIECLGPGGAFRGLKKPHNAEAELQQCSSLEKLRWDQRAGGQQQSLGVCKGKSRKCCLESLGRYQAREMWSGLKEGKAPAGRDPSSGY